MPVIVKMPFLSPTMKDGNLVKWCKQIGEGVQVGDVIAEIDTDKATMEVESLHNGILAKILVPEGTHGVSVHTEIAIIKQKGDTDEDVEKICNNPAQTPEHGVVDTSAPLLVSDSVPGNTWDNMLNDEKMTNSNNSVRASPLARRIAKEYGVDMSSIAHGSGPGGRIVKNDIPVSTYSETFIDTSPAPLRIAMIDRLTKCIQEVPHFYMQATANVTNVVQALRAIKERGITEIRITMNEFVIKAIALAMKGYPGINVSWIDGNIRFYKNIDISVAISVEDGIYTPVLRNAADKNIKQIAREIRELERKAKAGQLKFAELNGGSITTSNLGMCEISGFYSIINPPQASIISIARAMKSPIIAEDGTIRIGYLMNLGYAVDHRVIDGRMAGEFLTKIKQLLENPIEMLVGLF
jgi:pyruvate dehydrogenase E2 component (dihydrolipoamide acetyltransferase)